MNRLSLLLLGLILSHQLVAESDAQNWSQLLLQGKLPRDLRLWAELQPRVSLQNGHVTTVLVRPALGFQLADNLTLWGGYAWTPLLNPTSRNEHRAWGQAIISTDCGGLPFTQRFRIELRQIEGIAPIAYRVRYLSRLSLPIGQHAAVLYDELFLGLGGPAPTIASGLDQNRLFIGYNYRFSELFAVDAGYLWNAVRNPVTSSYRMNHVAMVTLYLSLDLVAPLVSE